MRKGAREDRLLDEALKRISSADALFREKYFSKLGVAQILAAGGYPNLAASIAKRAFEEGREDTYSLAEGNTLNGPPCGVERYTAGLLNKVGLASEATSAAGEFQNESGASGFDPRIVCAVDYFVGVGDFEKAKTVARQLSDNDDYYRMELKVSRLAAAGRLRDALQTAQRALLKAETSHDTIDLAVAADEIGLAAAAICTSPVLDTAFELAEELREPWRSYCLRSVLVSMANQKSRCRAVLKSRNMFCRAV